MVLCIDDMYNVAYVDLVTDKFTKIFDPGYGISTTLSDNDAATNDTKEAVIPYLPYQYRFLLQDQEAVQNKKRELQKELEEYRVYEQELDQLLEQMMKNGVSFLWRMN